MEPQRQSEAGTPRDAEAGGLTADAGIASAPNNPRVVRRRRRGARRTEYRSRGGIRLSAVLLILAVVCSVLPLGAVQVPVLLCVAPLALLAGVTTLAMDGVPRPRTRGVALVLAALSIYTFLQAIPLPFRVLTALSPANAEVWARALVPFGDAAPATAPLSLDPGATLVEALKWWSYTAVFLAAVAFGARYGVQRGALVILGSALLVAIASIGHGLSDAHRVFGVYTPRFGGSGWGLGALVNMNNRAGYLNLGALAGLGLVTAERPVLPRWLLGLATATVVGMSLVSASRGGVVALAVGLALFVLVSRLTAKPEEARKPRVWTRAASRLAPILVVACGMIFALLAATPFTKHLLHDTSVDKLRLPSFVVPMLKDHLWFGVGRGAFESAFPAYHVGPSTLIYTHTENFPVDWAAEWGVPVAIGLLVALAYLLRPKVWGLTRSTAAIGLFTGILCLALQNIVDIAFEVPGVVIAAVTAIGVALGASSAALEPKAPERRVSAWGAGSLAAVGVLTMALVAMYGTNTLAEDRTTVHEGLKKVIHDATERESLRVALRDAMARHPAEPYYPRVGAEYALRSRMDNPLPWVQQSLERGPGIGRTNYLTGLYLLSRGFRDQALMQFKLAVSEDSQLVRPVVGAVLKLAREEEDFSRVVPDERDGVPMLRALSGALRDRNPVLSVRYIEEIVRRDPTDTAARVALATVMLKAFEARDASPLCSASRRDECRLRAAQLVAGLSSLPGRAQEAIVLRARFLKADDRAPEGIRLLKENCAALRPRDKCLWSWLTESVAVRDRDSVTSAAHLLEVDGCSDAVTCANVLSQIASTIGQRDPLTAMGYYLRAAETDGSRARWMRAANAAEAVGDRGAAVRALNRAASVAGNDPEIQRRLDRHRLRDMVESRGAK